MDTYYISNVLEKKDLINKILSNINFLEYLHLDTLEWTNTQDFIDRVYSTIISDDSVSYREIKENLIFLGQKRLS